MWLNIEYKYILCCVYSQLLNHDYGTTEQQKYVWFRQPDKCANQPKNIISILHPKKIWASSTTIRNCYKCLKWAEPSNIECFLCVCVRYEPGVASLYTIRMSSISNIIRQETPTKKKIVVDLANVARCVDFIFVQKMGRNCYRMSAIESIPLLR